MLKAYYRLHEAVKRLLILGHILWWAWYTNSVISSYQVVWWRLLLNYLGPPIVTLIILNAYFLIRKSNNTPNMDS